MRKRHSILIHNGINQRDLEFIASSRFGVTVLSGNCDGHTILTHPRMDKPCTYNGRKKHASRAAVNWLRRLQRLLAQNCGMHSL